MVHRRRRIPLRMIHDIDLSTTSRYCSVTPERYRSHKAIILTVIIIVKSNENADIHDNASLLLVIVRFEKKK